MCTTDLCNANDYNIHTERANQLFTDAKNLNALPDTAVLVAKTNSSSSSNRHPLHFLKLEDKKGAREDDTSMTFSRDSTSSKVVSKVILEGNKERLEVLLEGVMQDDEDDLNRRTPRQVRQGTFFRKIDI